MKKSTSIAFLRLVCPTLIFIAAIFCPGQAQKVEAKSDQVWHFDGTDEMVVKDEYFATADSKGVVVLRDVETGKVIASEVFGGPIIDLSFSEKKGCLIIVYESTFLEPALSIEHFDFLNKKPLSIKILTSITSEVSGVDFNIDRKSILISTEDHDVILYNYETQENKIFPLDQSLTIAAFSKDTSCYFLSGNEDLTEISTYEYFMKIDSLEENGEARLQGICSDLNNKFVLLVDGEVFFMDCLNGYGIEINVDEFELDNEGELSVHDFEFSSNGQYLAVVGGKGTVSQYYSTGGPITINHNTSGYVKLYNVQKRKLVWKTSQKEFQSKFDVKDVGWTDEENFLVCDENGSIHSYHISEEFYTHDFPLPERQINHVSISDNFESILFSNKKSGTQIFKTSTELLDIQLSNEVHPYLQIFEDSLFFHTGTLTPENKIQNIVYGHQNNTPQSGTTWDETIGGTLSPNGKYLGVSTGVVLDLVHWERAHTKIENWLLGTDDQAIGYVENEQKFILPYQEFVITDTTTSLKFTQSSFSIVHDLESLDPTLTFIQNNNSTIEFSMNEQYVAFNGFEVSHIFDLKNMQWHPIHSDKKNELVYNRFDQNSNLVFSLFKNNRLKIWDCENNETILDKNLKIADFEFPTEHLSERLLDDFNIPQLTKTLAFDNEREKIYIHLGNQVYALNLLTKRFENLFPEKDIVQISLKQNQYLDLTNNDPFLDIYYHEIIDLTLLNTIYSEPFPKSLGPDGFSHVYTEAFFHESKPFVFLHDGFGSFELFDLESSEVKATLKLLDNSEWLVYTPDGLFDGSKQGRNSVYFIYDQEVILYNQIKQIYWEPNLLHKLINAQNLILTKNIDRGDKLYPKAELTLLDTEGTIQVNLIPDFYIGAVSLFINDKEVNTNVNLNRDPSFTINILDPKYKDYLFDLGTNKISFKTFNPTGTISSRPHSIYLTTNNSKGIDDKRKITRSKKRIKRNTSKKRPGLFGLFVGTSDYQNDKLDLLFADKDASALSDAFSKISSELYDEKRVNLKVLTSDSKEFANISSKENIILALNEIAEQAQPNDIIVLFFSGHGLSK